MFGIDIVILALVATAVVLGIITWSVARAEQRRYEEVMRTGEREALQLSAAARERAMDRAVALPGSSEPGSGFATPMPRAGSHASAADAARASAPPGA